MKKLALLVIVSAIFAPLAASAFDFGTAVRSYNITRDSTTRDQSSDQRLVEQLAKRIDNGDEVFVTKETREKRFISRFEQALSDSGLSPSQAVQTTHIVKIEEGGTVFYEVWTFRLYSNREGVEKLFAERYFLFCDKKS